MKSVNVLIASAGLVAGQAITSNIAAISSAAAQLNAAVSSFSEYSQASAIVDQSNQIVSLINQGTSDAKSDGSISLTEATGLLQPFQSLEAVVRSAIDNLVSRKAVATSLTLGNVVYAQINNQLTAAQAFASAVQAELPTDLASLGSSLAGAILSDLSSGSSAFSGLPGPTTLGSGPASGSGSSTGSTGSSSAASTGSSSSGSSSPSVTPSGTGVVPPVTNGTSSGVVPPTGPTPTVTPSNGADKAIVGFSVMGAAAFVAMLAL